MSLSLRKHKRRAAAGMPAAVRGSWRITTAIPAGTRADFNQRRTVETAKAGYTSQVKAERQRAKFPRKRK